MNKHEAKQALSEGKKLKHVCFGLDVFIYLECMNPNTRPIEYEIVFSYGETLSEKAFWESKNQPIWDNDWSISK